ncbi:MAG: hypothetical protein R3301_07300 [Saprospiraceae bacterium]|nr:hypothetical protein [Saprospiraceae bacterium]
MKYAIFFFLLLCGSTEIQAQIENDNTMSVMVDTAEFETEPRRIRVGKAVYITGNTIGPDKSLRIWMGTTDGREVLETGTYLIVDASGSKAANKHLKKTYDPTKYKGIALIKYVEETKSPRMEYHLGLSQNGTETLQAVMGDDGYLELTFDEVVLAGSWWKERASATILGGVGRLTNKLEDKAMTKATGYDQDIDPEGWGYRQMKETDTIVLKDGVVRLKIE